MRLLASLLWACLALKSHALPTEALVYLSEGSHLPSEWSLPSISPVTARLLLAQRLGLSQYHSLGDADEGTLLNILNTFGLHQTGVFEEKDDASGTEKVLVIIEGLSNPEGNAIRSLEGGVKAECDLQMSLDRVLVLRFP